MISHKRLEQILTKLNDTGDWFFMSLALEHEHRELMKLNFTDLLKLPKQYHQNLMRFFSKHSNDISYDFNYKMPEFIRQSTGLDLEQFIKLVTIQNKLNDLNSDFS